MASPIWPVYSKQNMPSSVEEKKSNDVLGKDQFLKILITQLQNQDPSQPLQDRDFIAQMAQFSSVEQLMNMSKEISTLRQSIGISSDLIGKEVSWLGMQGDSIVEMYGLVDSIIFDKGMQYVKIGDLAVPIDEIIRVTVPGQETPTDPVDDGEDAPIDEVKDPDETPELPGDDTQEDEGQNDPVTEGEGS